MPELPLVQQPVHPLFGGAMSIVLPHSCRDISTIKPLPDTREQFYSPEMGWTLTVDLMVALDKPLHEAILVYVRDIDLCSDSCTEVEQVQSDIELTWLSGITNGEQTGIIELAVIRDAEHATDYLVYAFFRDEALRNRCVEAARTLRLLDERLFIE